MRKKLGQRQDYYRPGSGNENDYAPAPDYRGVSKANINTLGTGQYNENRGRRGDDDWARPRTDNPFENGELSNWNHRQGWDQYYDRSRDRGFRNHGGSLVGHDLSSGNRGLGPRGYTRSDERIREDVCETLSASREIDASNIEVTVKEGCVYLMGEVDSREMKRRAELEIDLVSGVHDVQNQLSINKIERANTKPDGSERLTSLS